MISNTDNTNTRARFIKFSWKNQFCKGNMLSQITHSSGIPNPIALIFYNSFHEKFKHNLLCKNNRSRRSHNKRVIYSMDINCGTCMERKPLMVIHIPWPLLTLKSGVPSSCSHSDNDMLPSSYCRSNLGHPTSEMSKLCPGVLLREI